MQSCARLLLGMLDALRSFLPTRSAPHRAADAAALLQVVQIDAAQARYMDGGAAAAPAANKRHLRSGTDERASFKASMLLACDSTFATTVRRRAWHAIVACTAHRASCVACTHAGRSKIRVPQAPPSPRIRRVSGAARGPPHCAPLPLRRRRRRHSSLHAPQQAQRAAHKCLPLLTPLQCATRRSCLTM